MPGLQHGGRRVLHRRVPRAGLRRPGVHRRWEPRCEGLRHRHPAGAPHPLFCLRAGADAEGRVHGGPLPGAAELRGAHGLRLRGLHGLHLRDADRLQAHLQGRTCHAKGGTAVERTRVDLLGIALDNPVIPASGTFGYGREFAELYDIDCLGTFSFKGTTLHPRLGNPLPRIAEAPSGMLNAVGLQNPGVDRVISEELPNLATIFHKPVMANVSGFSIDEYVETCRRLDGCGQVGWLEVNISCPNVHGGGMSFGTDPVMAAEVTRAVKAVTAKPVIMKLSPNVTDIAAIARACEDAGADGVSLINTLLGMRIDLKARRPVIANVTGGLSGSAVFPVAVRMVYQAAKAVRIPVIGMGGVSSAEDVIEMMLAGATAVEVGAANLIDPFACKRIIEDLPSVMDRYGIAKLTDIIGGAL
ncbi:MAG: dihydroorotate dehydrogenase [Clostridia bacterium]|nr:dihydroorotate dehydrogenase [Clostridia bacterium]